jgi:hypothetical protein
LLCRVPLGAFVYSISIQLKSTWPSFRSSERGEVSSPVRLHYGKWEKIGLIPLKSAIQAEEQNTEAGDRQTVYHRSCPYFGCFLILFLDKKLYWIPERNLRQTRRSPQSIMEIYGQGLQRSPGANFAGKT